MQKTLLNWIQSNVAEWMSEKGMNLSPVTFIVEGTRNLNHGDWASNVALVLAKVFGENPKTIASALIERLNQNRLPDIERMEMAGPGFINFFVKKQQQAAGILSVLDEQANYGRGQTSNQRVLLEFVSSNPTGPLHVGHGRGAAFGGSLASLLRFAGQQVDCEYYVNDAGRQMAILTLSVWLRYLESDFFPEKGYQGAYIATIAQQLKQSHADVFASKVVSECSAIAAVQPDPEKQVDALVEVMKLGLGLQGFNALRSEVLSHMLKSIQADIQAFRVVFDHWFSEQKLFDSGQVDAVIETLKSQGHVYEENGAIWFKAKAFGDEKDRVLVRDNGEKTYFASDVAYHHDKLSRGYDQLINVFGADHHGYIPRLQAALQALGHDSEKLKVLIIQFAALFRGGERIAMTTRGGQYVTLSELSEEVGVDAARFFYVMRKPDQHMDFDLQLAIEQSSNNPVYYIQYAYARIQALRRKAEEKGWVFERPRCEDLLLLNTELERKMLLGVERFPREITRSAELYAPHRVSQFLRDLSADFHTFYNAMPILIEDAPLRNARLALLMSVGWVLHNGLTILGVQPREEM